jgi:peroxiredoxin
MRPRHSTHLLASAILIVISAAARSVSIPVLAPADDPPVDATLVDAAGRSVKLADFRGKRALVLLIMRGFTGEFACFHCSHQIAAWKEAYARVQAAGAEVLAVLPGAKSSRGFLERVAAVLDEKAGRDYAVPFPVLVDPDFSACRTFLVCFDPRPDAFPFPVSEPATIVLDRSGRLVYARHGIDPSDRPKVDAILDVLEHGAPRDGGMHGASPERPAAAAATVPAPTASALPWKGYAEGMALARSTGQPVLLDFHALW